MDIWALIEMSKEVLVGVLLFWMVLLAFVLTAIPIVGAAYLISLLF